MADVNVTGRAANEAQSTWLTEIYNRRTGEILGRTPKLWLYIAVYTAAVILFLAGFTLLLLHIALRIIMSKASMAANVEHLTRDSAGRRTAGLSTEPFIGSGAIEYTEDDEDTYGRYIEALDSALAAYKTRGVLGPCGARPYGYGRQPCVLVRLNKRLGWTATAIKDGGADPDLKRWARGGKLWLRCAGRDPSDREHLELAYHPDPPGVDPDLFPVNMSQPAPIVAVQVVRYTAGAALSVACQLHYAEGTGHVQFDLTVSPRQND